MKLVLISDTHNEHDKLSLPDGDVLVHAGDWTVNGKRVEIEAAANWLNKQAQRFEHVVCIAGNHDFFMEAAMKIGEEDSVREKMFVKNVHYLRDSGIQIRGLNFWGSPWSPWFYDWAFNARRGLDIRQHWDKIPSSTDVLVTHGPPKNILDWVGKTRVGCEELVTVLDRVRPKLHVFGHIHSAYGMKDLGIKFYNAAVVDEAYRLKNEPFVVEIEEGI